MTKEIRLLTGRHAGARIKLDPTHRYIGNDGEAEIHISDWNLPTMELSYHDDGRISIGNPAEISPVVALEDFVPRRFGDIVLCVGDAQAEWPSDIALLETMLLPTSMPVPAHGLETASLSQPVCVSRTRRGARQAGLVGVAVLAIGCAGIALPAVLHPRADRTMHEDMLQPNVGMLLGSLRRLQLDDVQVKPADGRFEIVGVVPDSASEMAARNTLEAIAPGKLIWRVGCVDQIIRDLQESLHDPALQVRYLGNRAFAVAGIAKHAGVAHVTLEQLSGDLAPMAVHIASEFKRTDRMAPPSDVESLLAVGNLQYVVSSDGTKHFDTAQAIPDVLN